MKNTKYLVIIIGVFLIIIILVHTYHCYSNNTINTNVGSDKCEWCVKPSCQFEDDMDSIFVKYWNAWGNDFDMYSISYSLVTGNMVVYVEYLKDYPAYRIDSSDQVNLFVSSINDFYLKKTIPIVEKKIKYDTDEHVEYEIPTFTVECYKRGKRVLLSSAPLEDGDYELVFNPRFEEFRNMIFSIVDKYDKYIKQTKEKKTIIGADIIRNKAMLR